MRRLVLAALLTACASDRVGSAAAPIVQGTRTTGDPAVVAIVARRARCEDNRPTMFCTGTLIASRVVLAAAHCLDAFGPDGAYEVVFGPTVARESTFAVVRRARAHPGYDRATHADDLALYELVDDAPAAPVTAASSSDGLTVGANARVVGFGVTRNKAEPEGIKREGLTKITRVDALSFEAAPNPAMTCSGDSGGPVFVKRADGVEVLAGVTVKGDPACSTVAFNLRVDAYWSSFVAPFLDEVGKTSDPAPTIAPHEMCAKTCNESSVCPLRLPCMTDFGGASRCTVLSMGVGAIMGACTSDAQCGAGGQCARIKPNGPDDCACFRPCTPIESPDSGVDAGGDAAGTAPAPRYLAGGGGCATSHEPSSGAWLVVLAVAGLRFSRTRSARHPRACSRRRVRGGHSVLPRAAPPETVRLGGTECADRTGTRRPARPPSRLSTTTETPCDTCSCKREGGFEVRRRRSARSAWRRDCARRYVCAATS